MALKFATGRDSRVKHASGTEARKIERARRRHPRPAYATGDGSPLRHMTGIRFDLKREMELDEAEEQRLAEIKGQKERWEPPGGQRPLPVAR